MAKYCGVQTCNHPGTIELGVNETMNGVAVKGTTWLCNRHYELAVPSANMAWPKGGQISFPAPESTRNMWDWRPRIGETPEQRLARLEQEKADHAYRMSKEFKMKRAETLGPFHVPPSECKVWEGGVSVDHEVVISFVEADVFQEDIIDALAFHGNYARRITVLEATE